MKKFCAILCAFALLVTGIPVAQAAQALESINIENINNNPPTPEMTAMLNQIQKELGEYNKRSVEEARAAVNSGEWAQGMLDIFRSALEGDNKDTAVESMTLTAACMLIAVMLSVAQMQRDTACAAREGEGNAIGSLAGAAATEQSAQAVAGTVSGLSGVIGTIAMAENMGTNGWRTISDYVAAMGQMMQGTIRAGTNLISEGATEMNADQKAAEAKVDSVREVFGAAQGIVNQLLVTIVIPFTAYASSPERMAAFLQSDEARGYLDQVQEVLGKVLEFVAAIKETEAATVNRAMAGSSSLEKMKETGEQCAQTLEDMKREAPLAGSMYTENAAETTDPGPVIFAGVIGLAAGVVVMALIVRRKKTAAAKA